MSARRVLTAALILVSACSTNNGGGTPNNTVPPVINSFTADSPTVNAGQSTTLRWSVTNATSITIDHGVGVVSGNFATVLPTDTTTYTLTATNAGGSNTAATTVTVHAAAPHVQYDDPAPGGKLRLVRNSTSTATHLVLDLKVGSSALSGFGVALTLPMPASKVTFSQAAGLILNAAVLDAGSTAPTAAAKVPSAGPLQDMLVAGVARKKQASTDGDVTLPAGATVFSIAIDMNGSATPGAIFNGGTLASPARAALLSKAGAEVASLADFAIGNLSISP